MNTLWMITDRFIFRWKLNQLMTGVTEEEKETRNKKLTRSYASVAAVGATMLVQVGIRSLKNIKSWREAVKYLPSVD